MTLARISPGAPCLAPQNSEIGGYASTREKLVSALEAAGVEFINGGRPGVRLRKGGEGTDMGLRFTRRVSLFPGLRVNFSKSGASLSVGHKAVWYTVGPRGRRVTLGLPGTGLYWIETVPPAPPPHAGHRLALLAVFAIAVIAVYWLAL